MDLSLLGGPLRAQSLKLLYLSMPLKYCNDHRVVVVSFYLFQINANLQVLLCLFVVIVSLLERIVNNYHCQCICDYMQCMHFLLC